MTKSKTIYGKMDPDLKARWVAALRSGQYKQTDGALKRGTASLNHKEGYCCLGVLAEVAGCKSITSDVGTITFYFRAPHYKMETGTGAIPAHFRNHIGLDSFAENKLIAMNDSGRKGFKAIANWIEKNL